VCIKFKTEFIYFLTRTREKKEGVMERTKGRAKKEHKRESKEKSERVRGRRLR